MPRVRKTVKRAMQNKFPRFFVRFGLWAEQQRQFNPCAGAPRAAASKARSTWPSMTGYGATALQ